MNNFKIGARQLHEDEVGLILPTYEQIIQQIEDMRLGSYTDDQNNIQKTNNIGILGCRGAGKTSVLKTIAGKLEKEKNNIVLPIIIPENMSESSSLMATILGLFKNTIDKIEEESAKENISNNCIKQNNTLLNSKYKEVIKRYAFIQKEYRDILINEFTTENEYVKRSNQIFNSDTEFINRFIEFVEELIKVKGEKTLIFFFIDDIDLSSNRCADVIKTLLSYISHKNIVTFISGDLDTFEEALTIDFLRQENALTNQVYDGEFLNDNQKLLERKKLLAYEYLKKVVPPVFRHNIKRWSLEDRGNYIIKFDEQNEDENKNAKNLSELLINSLGQYIEPSFFKFINYKEDPKGVKEHMPYTYHLFDDTSRGLNNVYNALLSINGRKKDENGDEDISDMKGTIKFSNRKILIETIAAAKPVFNRFREKLFTEIINFGSSESTTIIRFDNLKQMLYDSINISVVEKFQLFIFVDFAKRLLEYKENRLKDDNSSYFELKKYITNILVKNPIISGSSLTLGNIDDIGAHTHTDIDDVNEYLLGSDEKLLYNFLLKSEWNFVLTFYKNLSMDTYEFIKRKDHEKETFNYMNNIYMSLKSVSKLGNIKQIDIGDEDTTIEQYVSNIYEKFVQEFAYIQDSLHDEVRNIVEIIYKDLLEYMLRQSSINQNLTSLKDLDRRVKERNYHILIYNFFYREVKDEIFQSKRIKPLKYEDYEYKLSETERKRLRVICNIDANNQWDHSMASIVKEYVEFKISKLIDELFDIHEPVINIENFINDSFKEFKDIYKGVSNTKARQLHWKINNLIKNTTIENDNCIDFDIWCNVKREVNEIAYNYRIHYGQREAQNMLKDLNKAYLNIEVKGNSLLPLLHYVAIYTIKEKQNNINNIYLQSGQLSKFKQIISNSQEQVNEKMITDFMKSINKDIDIEINNDEFEKLFNKEDSSTGKKNVK